MSALSLLISINELLISINEVLISIIHLLISINKSMGGYFSDRQFGSPPMFYFIPASSTNIKIELTKKKNMIYFITRHQMVPLTRVKIGDGGFLERKFFGEGQTPQPSQVVARSSYLLTWRVNYVLWLKSPEIACQPCWTATPITGTRTSAYA